MAVAVTAAEETLKLAQKKLNTFHNYVDLSNTQTCDLRSPKRLSDEPFLKALHRSFAFLYQKYKGISLPDRRFRKITNAQLNELRSVVAPYMKGQGHETDFEKISQEIFNTPRLDLNKQLETWENYSPSHVLNRGSQKAVCSFAVSSYIDRLLPLLIYTDRQQEYLAHYSDYVCRGLPDQTEIISFDQENCVAISFDKNKLETMEEELGIKFGGKILVKQEFYPPGQSKIIYLQANKLLVISFIIDAIQKNGILETNIKPLKDLADRSASSRQRKGGRRYTRRKKQSRRSRSTFK